MADRRTSSTMGDPFKLTFLILAIIAFMYFAAEVLQPLALSVLLSFALVPVARFLERSGPAPRGRGRPDARGRPGVLGGVGYVVGRAVDVAGQPPAGLPREHRREAVGAAAEAGDDPAAGAEGDQGVAEKLDQPAVPTSVAEARRLAPRAARATTSRRCGSSSSPRSRSGSGDDRAPTWNSSGVGSFVLILVLFLLIGREDLSDRIVSSSARARSA